MCERPIISIPSLTQTLRSLAPGDHVHAGNIWTLAVIRQTASYAGISIRTKRTANGITIMRQIDIPDPT